MLPSEEEVHELLQQTLPPPPSEDPAFEEPLRTWVFEHINKVQFKGNPSYSSAQCHKSVYT